MLTRITSPQQITRRVVRSLASTASSFEHHNPSILSHSKIWRPRGLRMGWSPNVVESFLPLTAEIITSRSRHFDNIAVAYCGSPPSAASSVQNVTTNDPTRPCNGTSKRIEDSWLEIILPFSDQVSLRQSMVRANGKSLLYGKLFEILDSFAADVAYRHCGGHKEYGESVTIVTASIGGNHAYKNIDIESDVKIQGYITYVGNSSMEVTVDIISCDQNSNETLAGKTQFIMVSRTRSGQAFKVPGLIIDEPERLAEYERGKERASARRNRSKSSLSMTPPQPEEVAFIHNLHLQSRHMKEQKNVIIQQGAKMLGGANHLSELKSENIPMQNFKWMKNTQFKSVLFMHHQNRNVNGHIFGGFILKTAFDIAWIAAVCFFGHGNPIFHCIDDVQFVKPVEIGSIIEFASSVVYSSERIIVVQVEACQLHSEDGTRTKTNKLSYIFEAEMGAIVAPQVMPREYDEFVKYLRGRRCFEQHLPFIQSSGI